MDIVISNIVNMVMEKCKMLLHQNNHMVLVLSFVCKNYDGCNKYVESHWCYQ